MDERWNWFIDNAPLRSILNAAVFGLWFWLSVGLLALH